MNIQDIQTFAVLICLQYDYFYQAVTTCSSHVFDPNFSGVSPGNGSTSLQDDLGSDAWESGRPLGGWNRRKPGDSGDMPSLNLP